MTKRGMVRRTTANINFRNGACFHYHEGFGERFPRHSGLKETQRKPLSRRKNAAPAEQRKSLDF